MLPLLRTVVDIPQLTPKITYGSRIMFLGSCFSEEIGSKFEQYLFDTDVNPFGIIYNPASVYNSLKILLDNRLFTERDLFRRGQTWLSFSHHSRFSGTSSTEILEKINTRISASRQMLEKADYLFITFGTAWVYILNETGQIVSNCHKLPQKLFTRRMLEIDEIVEMYQTLIPGLWKFNPNLNIVFTISPVRHWKDGAVGNHYSKSVLMVAIQKIINLFPEVKYFPSYEIIMDELRDYRFYDQDMLHISPQGVDYIWLRFSDAFFDETTSKTMSEVEKVVKASQHRPQNKDTDEYRKFLASTIEKIMIIKKHHPYIKIDHLLEYFLNEQKTYGYAD